MNDPGPHRQAALSALVCRAREGDKAAFEDLVRLTYADAFSLALRLTGDEQDARDVLQEAYLRAYSGLARFRGDATFTTWLYRITANRAATFMTKRERHHHESLDAGLQVPERSPGSDPAERASTSCELVDVARVLDTLPPSWRAVVVLRDVYDLPYDVVAEELGVTVTAAKIRVHRARKRLREQLGPAARLQRGDRAAPVPPAEAGAQSGAAGRAEEVSPVAL